MIGPEEIEMAVFEASVVEVGKQAHEAGYDAQRWYLMGVMTVCRVLLEQLGEQP